MALDTYWDAGNKADSRQFHVFSLAVLSGTSELWGQFNDDWNSNLRSFGAKCLHTTDAWSLQDEFAGWAVQKRDDFLDGCARIAEKHHARASVGSSIGRYGLYCYVVSVDLKDFVEHAKSNRDVPQNVEECCFRQALAETLEWCIDQAASDTCNCFFDRNEPFYGHLINLCRSRRAPGVASALNRIGRIEELAAANSPALQLADFYAWCQNRRAWRQKSQWCDRILQTHFRWVWLDRQNLGAWDKRNAEIWRSWRLPTRGRTK